MKHLLKRVTAWLLCAALLVVPVQLSPVTASAEGEMPLLAFVPLDNRPVCVDRIEYQVASAGFNVQMPDEDLYKTLLDGQGGNIEPYGCQIGDGAAIMTWLETMEANGCDYYVIHLDQMFSGGLVGSRYPDSNSLTDTERNIMDRLIALSNIGGNHVYFVDTVMRLASTGSFKGYEIGEYSSFREYAAQIRLELDASAFSTTDYNTSVGQLDQIVANYQIGASGETLTYYTGTKTEWKSPLTQDQINTYHGSRRRKLDLINLMMQFGNRNVTYIIGVDDANPQFTIQGNEINFIKARMEALGYTYYLSADTDSAGMMAVARCVTDYYGDCGDNRIPVKVRYYGDMADQPADDYDIGTLRSNVQTHLESANCYVTDGEGEIEVLVLTKISTSHNIRDNGASSTYVNNINALVAQANANIAANKPTIVIEASTEMNYLMSWVKGYTNLQDELIAKVDISRLLGYSNWNTVGNSIGIAIGQGVARYSYLKNEQNITAASHTAFVQAMTFSYVKDITYNARNKHQNFTWTFQYWITNEVGGTGWNNGNFYSSMIAYKDNSDYKEDWESCRGEHVVNNELEYRMMQGGDASAYNGCGQQVINALMAGKIYTDLSGTVTTADIGTITLDKFYCPWYRQFEITFEIVASLDYYAVDTFVSGIPYQQTAASFADCAAAQFGVSAVTLKDLSGVEVANDTVVGTGFTVTVNGTTYELMIKGDTTGDGMSDTRDIRSIMSNILGTVTYSAAQTAAADHNESGSVSSTDARRLLQDLLNG